MDRKQELEVLIEYKIKVITNNANWLSNTTGNIRTYIDEITKHTQILNNYLDEYDQITD